MEDNIHVKYGIFNNIPEGFAVFELLLKSGRSIAIHDGEEVALPIIHVREREILEVHSVYFDYVSIFRKSESGEVRHIQRIKCSDIESIKFDKEKS